MNLLGFLYHFKEIIRFGSILELETKLVNNDKALVMPDRSGRGVDLRYEDLSGDTAGVEPPGLLLIDEAKLDLLGCIVIRAPGTDCGPFFINHFQH